MNVSEINVGDMLYHVAHPDVPCKIMGPIEAQSYIPESYWIPAEFSSGVIFKHSGFPRTPRVFWLCSTHLLFKTPEEARANHNPNYEQEYLLKTKAAIEAYDVI